MKFISNLFKGRINRRNFVIGLISSETLIFIVILGFGSFLESIFNNNVPTLVGYLFVIFFISILLFNVSLFVRRWHDLGNTGLYIIFNFIPIISIFTVFYVIFKSGQKKQNQYGKVPQNKVHYPQDILGLN